MLRSLEDLLHGLNQTNTFSMSLSESCKIKAPNLAYFKDFLDTTYKNHNVLKHKICKSVHSINICGKNLEKLNEEYLKYKSIHLPFKDEFRNFSDHCQKIVNQSGVE